MLNKQYFIPEPEEFIAESPMSAELKQIKKVRDEEEKVLKALSSKRHNKDQTDTYLNETMNILLDLIQLPDQPAKS